MIKYLYTSFFLVIVFGINITCAQNPTICSDNSLSCAITNFDELYMKDYDRFWDIFNNAEKEAISCSSAQKTSEFLEVASAKKGNAEFNEYFMDVLENQLVLKRAKCFMNAILLTSENSRKIIFNDLKNPLFNEKKDISNQIKPFMNDTKYKEVIDKYFTDEN